jgi:hypothetical protein
LVDQFFVTTNELIGVGLVPILIGLIAYVWPKVKEKVEQDRNERLDQLGKSIASDFILMMGANRSLFEGPPTEGTWKAIGEFYSNAMRQQVIALSAPNVLGRPLSTLRSAGIWLIVAICCFLGAALISFTYETSAPLFSLVGVVASGGFLGNVAYLWHDLTR